MSKKEVYYLTLSILYIFYGLVQTLNGLVSIVSIEPIQICIKLGSICIPNIFPDFFAGVSLLTIGLLFITTLYYHRVDKKKSEGYLLVGWILAVLLFILNILEIAANILDAYYPIIFGKEPNFIWSLSTDPWGFAPQLLLGILSLPIYSSIKSYLTELFPGK